MDEHTISERGIEVPHTALDADVLRRIIEEFVTRDGTDYGLTETSLDNKVAAVMRQLADGDAKIFFEADSETINIIVV